MKDSEYKKLLIEALDRVNEDVSVKIATDDGKIYGTKDLDAALQVGKDDRIDTYGSRGASKYKKAVADLADNSGDNKKVEDGDFDRIPSSEAPQTIDLMKLLKLSSNPDLKQSAEDVLNKPPEELTSDFKTATAAADSVDTFAQGSLGDVRSSATFATDASGSDFEKINNFKVAAPQSMIDRFAQIRGADNKGGLLAKFQELTDFGKKLEGGKDAVEDWMKEKVAQDGISPLQAQLLFMTYVPAYLLLADISKVISGNEAGYAFEKYLALLLNSPILGGANGAADNVSQIIDGEEYVYMSAKIYIGYNFQGVSQALGGSEGVDKLVKENGKDLFYITIAKVGNISGKLETGSKEDSTEKQYNAMAVFVSKVYYSEGKYMVDVYSGDGTVAHTSEAIVKTKEVDGERVPDRVGVLPSKYLKGTGGTVPERLLRDLKTFLIPVPVIAANPDKISDLAGLSADYVAKVADNFSNTLIGTVRNIYTTLDGAQESTKSYTAVRSRKDGAGQSVDSTKTAINYVNQVGESYSKLFQHFKSLFEQLGDLSQVTDSEEGAVFRKGITPPSVQESASIGLEEIKKLTEEILKEMLKEGE